MADTDLSKVLSECCEAARSGYELASGEKDVLDGILTSAEEKIRETAVEYKVSPCEIVGIGETLEGQLADEKLGALLVLADLAERHGAGAETVRLLHAADVGSGSLLVRGRLGRDSLAGRLAAGHLTGSMLNTGHC